MLLLDTSVLSGVMHRDPACLERLRGHQPNDVAPCAPVAAEISFGLALLPPRSRRRRLLRKEYDLLRSAVMWLDWTEEAARRFGARESAGRAQIPGPREKVYSTPNGSLPRSRARAWSEAISF